MKAMGTNNDNGFSLLNLLAESELKRRNKTKSVSSKQLSKEDTNGVAEMVKDSIIDQTVNIDGEPYTINAMELEKNSILLWLWSDSADDDKTIKITLRVDELDVDPNYWNEDNG